ncbi:MAG TPA: InlB B-repeat-containing protein [Puia sp.]|nr:InlB B-repeat-containing protein [Puia sp.]
MKKAMITIKKTAQSNPILRAASIKPLLFVLAIGTAAVPAVSCKKSKPAVDRTCTVAFILNETNSAGDTTFVKVQAGQLVQNAPVPARAGYNFDGWYTNSADANPNPAKNTAAPKFPAYDITVKPIYLDAILYARWVQ